MVRWLAIAAAGLAVTACSSSRAATVPGNPDVVIVEDGERDAETRRPGPRRLRGVPPGHYPPPGHCRVWYEGRPPGQQPPPTPCAQIGRVPRGAFVLYNGADYDTRYDWQRLERARPGSVPRVILQVMQNLTD